MKRSQVSKTVGPIKALYPALLRYRKDTLSIFGKVISRKEQSRRRFIETTITLILNAQMYSTIHHYRQKLAGSDCVYDGLFNMPLHKETRSIAQLYSSTICSEECSLLLEFPAAITYRSRQVASFRVEKF